MEKIKEQKRLHKLGILLRNNLNICFLVFMILFGVLFAKKFTSPANLQNLLKQMSVNAMLATGFSICFIADGFDLSQGNVCSACGCVALSVLINTGSWLLAMGAALLVGLLFGLFGSIGSLHNNLKSIDREGKEDTPRTPPPISFNNH